MIISYYLNYYKLLLLNFGKYPLSLRSWLSILSTNISIFFVFHVAMPIFPLWIRQIIAVVIFARNPLEFPFTLSPWKIIPSSSIASLVLHVEVNLWPFLGRDQVSTITLLHKFEVTLCSWISGLSSCRVIFLILQV